jgi:hypothetical protein
MLKVFFARRRPFAPSPLPRAARAVMVAERRRQPLPTPPGRDGAAMEASG